MPNLEIRDLDEAALIELKRRAARQGLSVNALVLHLIDLGLDRLQAPPRRCNDLDQLAGSWTAGEARAFERATAPFRAVDPRAWK